MIIKTGTNDAVLTRDGRIPRVEGRVVERTLQLYKGTLKDQELEALTLEEFRRRIYPDRPAAPERQPDAVLATIRI